MDCLICFFGEVFVEGALDQAGELVVGGKAEADDLADGECLAAGEQVGGQQRGEAEFLFEANDAVLGDQGVGAGFADGQESDDRDEGSTRERGGGDRASGGSVAQMAKMKLSRSTGSDEEVRRVGRSGCGSCNSGVRAWGGSFSCVAAGFMDESKSESQRTQSDERTQRKPGPMLGDAEMIHGTGGLR